MGGQEANFKKTFPSSNNSNTVMVNEELNPLLRSKLKLSFWATIRGGAKTNFETSLYFPTLPPQTTNKPKIAMIHKELHSPIQSKLINLQAKEATDISINSNTP